jgi:flagellar motor protein MotB
MKLTSIITEAEFAKLAELNVPMPTAGGMPAPGAIAQPGMANPLAAAIQDPQAQAKMQAQQVLDKNNQKKQLQDAIRQKQQELSDLQKQLAQIR